MSQKIAVAVIHGIGKQGPDFFDRIKADIETYYGPECANNVAIEPVYWARVTQALEDTLWERLMGSGPMDFQTARRLVIDFLADAIAYQPTANDRETYDGIHAEFAKTLRRLSERAGANAPLCIIAHSLGTIIASNFIYDLQKPQLITEPVRAEMTNTPLERGETVSLLYTLGSPLALWSLRYRDFGRPIAVPSPKLKEHYPKLEGEWINYYDRDDVIAFPIKGLNQAYSTAVKADIECNVGGVFTSWNPLSHLEYWSAKSVIEPIAKALIRTWRVVNQ